MCLLVSFCRKGELAEQRGTQYQYRADGTEKCKAFTQEQGREDDGRDRVDIAEQGCRLGGQVLDGTEIEGVSKTGVDDTHHQQENQRQGRPGHSGT